ncbi:hypothetical protein [Persephonella sp.]
MELEKAVIEAILKIGLPVKIGQLEKETGIDRNTLQKVVNDLSIKGILTTDRCYNKITAVKGESDDR